MKHFFKIISRVGLISAALFLFIYLPTMSSAETNEVESLVPSNSISVMTEDESSWTEEHEGNGPEGGREILMERMPASKVALVCGLVLATASLAWYQSRESGHGKAKN
jgi:hypothetical protein